MRYTLALVFMLAGCSPAAPVSDAGALPPGWEECPAECVISCAPAGYSWCGEFDLPQCLGCAPLCSRPESGDAGEPEMMECDLAPNFWCGGAIVDPSSGGCFRRR